MNARFAQPQVWTAARLKANPRNARVHPPEQIEMLRGSIREYGQTLPLLIDEDGNIIAGHGRLEALMAEGYTDVSVVVAKDWTEKQKRAYALLDNRVAEGALWNQELVRIELGAIQALDGPMPITGFDLAALDTGLLFGGAPGGSGEPSAPRPITGSLADKFFAVPFSVINAREGWWQNRKAQWLALGIQSELGRGENLLKMSDTALEPDPEKRKAMVAKREKRKAKEASA